MITVDEQPEAPAVEDTITPPAAPKVRKTRAAAGAPKAKAKANGKRKAKVAAKATKAAPKGKGKAIAAKVARNRDPAKLDQFGYRKGSIRSQAAQFYASKKGGTLAESKDRFNGVVQYNVLTEQRKRGNKVLETKERNDNGREVIRYKLVAKAAA